MIGRRVDGYDGTWLLSPGEYAYWQAAGYWIADTPNGHGANLAGHQVTEHEDGTITVSPSISVSTSVDGQKVEVYHGYLERGVWRDV